MLRSWGSRQTHNFLKSGTTQIGSNDATQTDVLGELKLSAPNAGYYVRSYIFRW